MKENISKVTTLIPELYYDIISRVTVGIIFEIGLFYLITEYQNIKPNKDWTFVFSPLLILLLVILFSYIIGLLIATISQTYQNFLRIGFNPTVDFVSINLKLGLKKKIILLVEFILGFPFSLLLIKEYRFKRFKRAYIVKLKALMDQSFPKIEGHQRYRLCRDYVRFIDKEMGSVLMKMQAESNMCRNLAIAILLLMIYSMIFGSQNEIIVEWFGFSLSTTAYSSRRRILVESVFNYFVLLTDSKNKNG